MILLRDILEKFNSATFDRFGGSVQMGEDVYTVTS